MAKSVVNAVYRLKRLLSAYRRYWNESWETGPRYKTIIQVKLTYEDLIEFKARFELASVGFLDRPVFAFPLPIDRTLKIQFNNDNLDRFQWSLFNHLSHQEARGEIHIIGKTNQMATHYCRQPGIDDPHLLEILAINRRDQSWFEFLFNVLADMLDVQELERFTMSSAR